MRGYALVRRRLQPPLALGMLVAVLCIAVETALTALLALIAPVHTANMVYLIGIAVVGWVWGPGFGLVAAVASAVTFDYFLLPPVWSLRPHKLTDLSVPAIFLTVALLACLFSALARSLADARQDADLSAELARLLLRGPDERTTRKAAAQYLARTLKLPSASIEMDAIPPDEQHEAFPLRDKNETLGTLVVPAGLTKPMLRHLRDRVVPSLEALLSAARERERTADALKASRARVVIAAETRRRIERDLHDGTQHLLLSILYKVRAIQDATPPGLADLKVQLANAVQIAEEASAELQEIARDLYPAAVEKAGIQSALKQLARRSPIAVDLNVSTDRRLPKRVEMAIYHAASEALTNVAKHARASIVHIDLTSNALVRLSIRDDGIGGADSCRGSGLLGLTDHIQALDGTMEILSPTGGGTELLIELPFDCCSRAETTRPEIPG